MSDIKIDYSKINLVLGIPSMGSCDWRFASCLRTLDLPFNTNMVWVVRTMIDSARNMLVENALKIPDATHLLMIDDDHVFSPDLVKRMLDHNVDVIGALAFKRNDDFQPCCYRKGEDNHHYPMLPSVFQEVDVIGTGAMLFKLDIFKDNKLKFPWFETGYDKETPPNHWSVDFNFCIKAKEAGYKIWCDPTIEIGHIALPEVTGRANFVNYIETHKTPWQEIKVDTNKTDTSSNKTI